MQVKTYVGKLSVRTGEFENKVTRLLVANSNNAARELLEKDAQDYYAGGISQDGGYYSSHGEVFVKIDIVQEIGLASFLDFKQHLPVISSSQTSVPDVTALGDSVQSCAKALTKALNRKGKLVSLSQMLHAVAAALGDNNWHVLKSKASTGLGGSEQTTVSSSLEQRRRKIADVLFEDADLGKVEAVNGWETCGDSWTRVYYVDEGNTDSTQRCFSVEFSAGTSDVAYATR